MTKGSGQKPDKLAKACKRITPARLKKALSKSAKKRAITFRVSEEEWESIHRVTERCGLSVTEYFMRLHQMVREKLK